MNLPANLFSLPWHTIALLLTVASLFIAVRGIGWRALLASGMRLNCLFGFGVIMALLWSLRAGVLPGLNLHLLGAMAACLIFGPRLALIAMTLPLTGITLNGAVEWQAWPINFVVMGLVPVMVAHGLRRLVERFLPTHFFVFVFALAFAGAAVVMMMTGLFASLLLFAAGAYPWSLLMSDYLPYFLLLGFSEAWICGAIVTMMVVYKPEWVEAFNERNYLDKR